MIHRAGGSKAKVRVKKITVTHVESSEGVRRTMDMGGAIENKECRPQSKGAAAPLWYKLHVTPLHILLLLLPILLLLLLLPLLLLLLLLLPLLILYTPYLLYLNFTCVCACVCEKS